MRFRRIDVQFNTIFSRPRNSLPVRRKRKTRLCVLANVSEGRRHCAVRKVRHLCCLLNRRASKSSIQSILQTSIKDPYRPLAATVLSACYRNKTLQLSKSFAIARIEIVNEQDPADKASSYAVS
jgi:hypothetical protein